MRKKTEYIIVHCSDSDFGNAGMIRLWHLDRGFRDIGYHFVIGNQYPETTKSENYIFDGSLEIGRPIKEEGAHCKGLNHNSVGICLIGKDNFTVDQYYTLLDLVDFLMKKYDIPIENVIGHNETDSGKVQDKTCPNFDVEYIRNNITNDGEMTYPENFI